MSIDYDYINKWLYERNITLQPYFTEQLKTYACLFGKNII